MILSIACAVVAAATGAACQDQQQTLGPRSILASVVVDSSITPVADSYVKASSGANTNYGTDTLLLVIAGPHRSLVRFDQTQIATAIGVDSLVSATVQLTIASIGNWDGGSGTLYLHRLTRTWTEAGATWNCGIDTNPANGSADCNEVGQWPMGSPTSTDPYLSTATSNVTVTTNQTGVVQLDVTADVRAFLAGTTNNGWLVKKDEAHEGFAQFRSKETNSKPRLLLSLVQGDTSAPAIPATFTPPVDSSHTVTNAADSGVIYYRDILVLFFSEGTSGVRIREVLSKYGATIIGGSPLPPAAYYVRIPDPGANYAQARAVRDSIGAESGVALAKLVAFRGRSPEPNGRYPNDGSQAHRSDWLSSGTDVTRAFLAARATLAWSCETGLYGGSGITLGDIDHVFDTAQADYRKRPLILREPTEPDSELVNNPSLTVGNLRWHHGTAVAGVLGARSDNDSGVAGMYWGGRLALYAISRGIRRVESPLDYIFRVTIPKAISDSVRVLNLSIDFRSADDASFAEDYTFAANTMIRFLRASPKNLIVLAAGNRRIRASAQDWRSGNTSERWVFAGAAAIIDTSAYRNQLIVVAGTQAPDEFWNGAGLDGSNYIGGVSVLAAGATSRATLSHSQGPGGQGLHVADGTSYAAPMVAGTAALMMSMDSTITAAEVKGILERPEVLSSDGVLTERPAVAVTGGGTVYQLDAYSALALLSQEQPHLPVCGFGVRFGAGTTSSVYLVLERPVAAESSLKNYTGFVRGLSVAQGGRLIGFSDSASTITFDNRFVSKGSRPGRRVFLERDTVEVIHNSNQGGAQWESFRFHRADSTTSTVKDPFTSLTNNFFRSGRGVVDPSTQTLALIVNRDCTQPCHTQIVSYIAPVATLVPVQVALDEYLGTPLIRASAIQGSLVMDQNVDGSVEAFWSHNGDAAVFLRITRTQNTMFTNITRATVTGNHTDATVNGLSLFAGRFTADDSLFVNGATDGSSTCIRQVRQATSPFTAVSSGSAPDVECIDAPYAEHQPNLHASLRAVAANVDTRARATTSVRFSAPGGRIALVN